MAASTALARPTSTISRVFESRWVQYRRTFRASIFSSFMSPVLFLAAMGLGLGTYVSGSAIDDIGGVPYLVFLAPGLLAATCMQSAAFEATFPIMGGLVWNKVFRAMYATPITPTDIALGNLLWIAARMVMIASVFTLVMVLFGAAHSPLVVLAIPAAVLTGMAFAAPIAAFSATQKTVNKFNAVFRFGITPLFLFSGTFFPVESLPEVIRPIAWISPLYHGATLTRALSLGTAANDPVLALIHVVVMGACVVIGTWAAIRTIRRALVLG
jgi:lipooligosaccharide transport system permease protein